MSTIVRRKRTSRTGLGPYKRHELLTGEIIYPLPQYYTGYGDGVGKDLTAFISDEMRADWEANRDELLEFWKSGKVTYEVFPDTLPWQLAYGNRKTLPWAAKHLDKKPSDDAS
jgi:hypothetical protein